MLNGIKSTEIDMNKVCRTCLATGELISIYKPCSTGPCILQKLTSVTSKKYYDCFGLPSQVCNVCIYEINRAYKFATKCHETDRKLRDYIRKINAQSDDSTALSKVVGHFENVGFDLTGSAHQRSIHVTINYDSDESDLSEINENNHDNKTAHELSAYCAKSDEEICNFQVNRTPKIVENDIKIELTSEIDLGITELSNHSVEEINVLNSDSELQIKTEIDDNSSDSRISNGIGNNFESECSLTSDVFNTSEVNINKINQTDNQNTVSLNFKSKIPTSAVENQISPYQESNLEESNNENRITIQTSFEITDTPISNLEFSEYGIDFEERVLLDQDSNQTQLAFEKHMKEFLAKISPSPDDQLHKEIDSFEIDIQNFIDKESPKLQIHTEATDSETRNYFDLDLVKPELDELDPLVIDEAVCNDLRNETVPIEQPNGKNNDEIIFAEINIENVLSQTLDNKIYYKINSNICTLKNQILPITNNYQNIVNHSDLHNIPNNVIDLTNNHTTTETSTSKYNNIRNLRKILPNNHELCHSDKPSYDLPNSRINSKTNETNTKNYQNTGNKSQIDVHTSQSKYKNILITEELIELEPYKNSDNLQILSNNWTNPVDNVGNVQNNHKNCSMNVMKNDKIVNGHQTEKIPWKDGRKYHRCSVCSRTVRHLTRHMRGHTENASTMCEICGKILKNSKHFIKHQIAHKTRRTKEFKCDACAKSFFELKHLRQHRHVHKTTSICEQRLIRSNPKHRCDNLPENAKDITADPVQQTKELIKCDKCDATFTSVDTYNTHYLIHTTKKESCAKCKQMFDSNQLLTEHLKTHTEPITDHVITPGKQFSCDFCDRKFTFHTQLIYHLKIHKTKKLNECKYCGESFVKYHFFRNHKCKKFPDNNCPTCNEHFDSAFKLKQHFKTHVSKS